MDEKEQFKYNIDMSDAQVGVDLSNPNMNASTQVFSYENKDHSFKGELKNYNYNAILKDKQTHIYKLMEISSYYLGADSLYSGIISRVLTPFSLSCGWSLSGNEKSKEKFLNHYENTNFPDAMRSIFFELYTFANVYTYFMPNGNLITLCPTRVKIADISINGEPVLEYNVVELNRRNTATSKEEFLKTTALKYNGYPPEIGISILSGNCGGWVQLNPENTFVLQESKPMWQKYANPFISTCMKTLAKKELISYYEDIQLNIGAKSFLHVKLGDNDLLPKPNAQMLNSTAKIFQDALNKFPLAVTSHLISSEFKSIDSSGLFDKSKYSEVNRDILSAAGISELVITGNSDGGSFAQANISVKTLAQRITQNQQNFSEMMKKYNKKLAKIFRISESKLPVFKFNELDLTNENNLRTEAISLWTQGVISTTTLLEQHQYDVEQEFERKQEEKKRDFKTVFEPPINPNTMPSNTTENPDKGGAPKKPMKDSKQDKNNNVSNPKPSN